MLAKRNRTIEPSDISISSEEDEVEMLAQAMDELNLGRVPLPIMVWTSIKYKTSQVAQFISLMQNTNMKLPQSAKEAKVEYTMGYIFNKEWKANGGTALQGYKLASEIKRKGNNVKVTEEHPQFIEDYLEKNRTCIVKDVTELPCATFEDLCVNKFTVYRHITDKLESTLTHTQAILAARNSDDTKEQRRQFVEYLSESNIDYKRSHGPRKEHLQKRNTSTIQSWISKLIHLSTDKKRVSLRSSASSLALQSGIPKDDLVIMGNWASSKTFKDNYRQEHLSTFDFTNTLITSDDTQDDDSQDDDVFYDATDDNMEFV
ncbi:hypothetical protein G6F37_010597 [Rhizopus arrhizus]|nr:hypothetical protein G6F38_010380 [Rhizopus arrhizus]KAG1153173.1 hypothetical protein G6F37_010597 [Rhizopus arrhizus]